MLLTFSTYRALVTNSETGAIESPNNFGRIAYSTILKNTGHSRADQEAGYNILADYEQNIFKKNTFKDILNPYIRNKLASDPNYSSLNDPDLPVMPQGQGKSIADKYLNLSNKTYKQLINSEDPLLAGAMAETQPYVERMLIDTVKQAHLSSSDRSSVDSNYAVNGVSSVKEVLNSDEINSNISVKFAYALGNDFLRLDQSYKAKFVQMSLNDQWNMLYEADNAKKAYIDSKAAVYSAQLKNSAVEYNFALSQEQESMNLTSVLSKFSNHLSATNINYQNKFETTFQLQTQKMDFSPVSTTLKDIYQLYKGILGRDPDKAGFEYWVKDFNGGQSLNQQASNFTASTEFQGKVSQVGTKVTFDQTLTALYQIVLGRTPDASGETYWKGIYSNNGGNLGEIATGFTKSVEYGANVDQDLHAWFARTYGANLTDMDYTGLGFNNDSIEQIKAVGAFDLNSNTGYEGIIL